MKIYFSAKENTFYNDSWHKSIPKDAKEISLQLHSKIQEEISLGRKLTSDSTGYPITEHYEGNVEKVELEWVESQLNIAREELEKVQDSDTKAVGSVSNWRDYRKELRLWAENPNFPDKLYRPKSPIS